MKKKEEDKCEKCMCRLCGYQYGCGQCPGYKSDDCPKIIEDCMYFVEEP